MCEEVVRSEEAQDSCGRLHSLAAQNPGLAVLRENQARVALKLSGWFCVRGRPDEVRELYCTMTQLLEAHLDEWLLLDLAAAIAVASVSAPAKAGRFGDLMEVDELVQNTALDYFAPLFIDSVADTTAILNEACGEGGVTDRPTELYRRLAAMVSENAEMRDVPAACGLDRRIQESVRQTSPFPERSTGRRVPRPT